MKWIAIIVIALLVSISSCQSDTSGIINKRVDQSDFKEAIATLASIQLVDVRTPEEYLNGHIEGASNINFNGKNFEKELLQLNKTNPVLVYCYGGGRSSKTLEKLKELGFMHALELRGGYSKWE